MLGLVYKLHKWIGIGIGIVIGMWLVSGMVMVTFPERPTRVARGKVPPLDLTQATVSPAQAAGTAGTAVEDLALVRILDVPVYLLSTASGSRLIDARNGTPFVVTDLVARAIAIRHAGRTEVASIVVLHEKDQPPGYRVRFADRSRLIVDVSTADGSARVSDRVNRFRKVMGSLHSFRVLSSVFTGRNRAPALLVVAGLTALACVLTGYMVLLPRRQRNRSSQES